MISDFVGMNGVGYLRHGWMERGRGQWRVEYVVIGFWCLGSWSGDRDSLLYHGQLRQEVNISHGPSSQRVKDMTESMKRKETNNERVQGYLEKIMGCLSFFG